MYNKQYTAFYFSAIIINSTLNRNDLDPKLKDARGANFDMVIEIQLAHNHKINIDQGRIECDSASNPNDNDLIDLICVLNIVPTSVDQNVNFIIYFIFYILYLYICN